MLFLIKDVVDFSMQDAKWLLQIGVGVGCAVKLMKYMKEIADLLKQHNHEAKQTGMKLNIMERRMEKFMQSGQETARRLRSLFEEYQIQLAKGSLKWVQRQAYDLYGDWHAARVRLNEPRSNEEWAFVVQSAVEWVKMDMSAALASEWMKTAPKDEVADTEQWVNNLQSNLEFIQKWIPMLNGVQVEPGRQAVDKYLEKHGGDAYWTNAVCYQSSQIQEPIGDYDQTLEEYARIELQNKKKSKDQWKPKQ